MADAPTATFTPSPALLAVLAKDKQLKELDARIALHMYWCGPEIKSNDDLLRFLVLALAGEAGELANLVKKLWRDPAYQPSDGTDVGAALKEEVADNLNYCFMIAKLLEVDPHQIMLDKLIEVEARPAFIAA